jgi:hypothetical protein
MAEAQGFEPVIIWIVPVSASKVYRTRSFITSSRPDTEAKAFHLLATATCLLATCHLLPMYPVERVLDNLFIQIGH